MKYDKRIAIPISILVVLMMVLPQYNLIIGIFFIPIILYLIAITSTDYWLTDAKKLYVKARNAAAGIHTLSDWDDPEVEEKNWDSFEDKMLYFIVRKGQRTMLELNMHIAENIPLIASYKNHSIEIRSLSEWRDFVMKKAYRTLEKKTESEEAEHLRSIGYKVEYVGRGSRSIIGGDSEKSQTHNQ